MPFLSITYNNFRNLENKTVDLLSKEVYFVGENGQGKTNILESLYMTAYGSSFRTRNDSEIIRFGEFNYGIKGLYKDSKDKTHSIILQVQDNKKRIEKNSKKINDRKELIDTIPCILFSHEDLDFAVGSLERKRFFIDQSLSMYDPTYIDLLRKYKKVLKTRNLVLKEEKINLLDSLDIQLAEIGLEIIKKRKRTIFDFNLIFTDLYEKLTQIDNVSIDYSPAWKFENTEQILVYLSEKRQIDCYFKTSMSGPHRDRIRFVRNKKAFIPTASTGQRRLISLLLRSAQAHYYTNTSGKYPVLLMDDVLLELDPDKRKNFTSLLPKYDQLFCTFLPGEPYERYKQSTTKVIQIKNGMWYE